MASEKCTRLLLYISCISFFRAAYSRGTDRRHSTNLISRNPLKGIYEASTNVGLLYDWVLVDNPIARWDVYNRDKSRETLALARRYTICGLGEVQRGNFKSISVFDKGRKGVTIFREPQRRDYEIRIRSVSLVTR